MLKTRSRVGKLWPQQEYFQRIWENTNWAQPEGEPAMMQHSDGVSACETERAQPDKWTELVKTQDIWTLRSFGLSPTHSHSADNLSVCSGLNHHQFYEVLWEGKTGYPHLPTTEHPNDLAAETKFYYHFYSSGLKFLSQKSCLWPLSLNTKWLWKSAFAADLVVLKGIQGKTIPPCLCSSKAAMMTSNLVWILRYVKLLYTFQDLHSHMNLQCTGFLSTNHCSSSFCWIPRYLQRKFLNFEILLDVHLRRFHLIFNWKWLICSVMTC